MKIFEVIDSEIQNPRDLLVEYAGIELYANENCQPYLNEIGGFKNAVFVHPLYRGIGGLDFTKTVHSKVINVNQNRSPTDTPVETQNLIDNWFEQNFGVRFRQTSLHCTGAIRTARAYGEIFVIIPVGNFNYCWSPIYVDMFDALANSDTRDVNKFMNNGDYLFNKELIRAINDGNEVMVSCKKALVVEQSFLKDLVIAQHNAKGGLQV